MKIGIFGSCLSSDPAAHLSSRYGCTQHLRVFHNRSDQFIKYHLESRPYPYQLDNECAARAAKEHKKSAKNILFNQSPKSVGFEGPLQTDADCCGATPLAERVKTLDLDIILIDNFMDIVGRLLQRKDRPGEGIFFPSHFVEDSHEFNKKHELTKHLLPSESAENFLRITRFFRATNPNASIVFICWHATSSRSNRERLSRILDFYRAFSHIAAHEDITIIPPLQVPEAYTKGVKDWYHLDTRAYQSIAGLAFFHKISKLRMVFSNHVNTTYNPS